MLVSAALACWLLASSQACFEGTTYEVLMKLAMWVGGETIHELHYSIVNTSSVNACCRNMKFGVWPGAGVLVDVSDVQRCIFGKGGIVELHIRSSHVMNSRFYRL